MPEDVEIIGLPEFEKAMEQLGPELAGNVLRPAMARAARTMRNALLARVRATFKAQSGRLFKGIQSEVNVEPGKGGKGAVIKWRVGLGNVGTKGAPFYGRFWDQGFLHIGRSKKQSRTLRRIRRGGQNSRLIGQKFESVPGKFYRKEWMTPAFEGVVRPILNQLISDIRSGLAEAVERVRLATRLAGKL